MTRNHLDSKKNHFLSILITALVKVYKSYLFEVLLMFLFTYFTLITSWYFSVSIFFLYFDLFPKAFIRNLDLVILIICLTGFFCYIFHKLNFRKWHKKDKKIFKFEKLLENAVYIVSLSFALIFTLFSFAFDKGLILVLGIAIICSFIFYISTSLIFTFCLNYDVYKNDKNSEHINKILFSVSFIAVYLIFENIDVLDNFIFDNTSLLMRDISKIKRGWELVKSMQVYGHLLSISFIIYAAIHLLLLVRKNKKLYNK